ncbi:Hypothetical predicted protein [Podarcis lilfordi]|uniref:Uncharacterized protein n=1 Tax=Podarcis lilfordi TaxID=74358 RepID=A0AA35PKB5_9SAUR|nr:Hypothetical predicted protein [Podarcis lilfordi]
MSEPSKGLHVVMMSTFWTAVIHHDEHTVKRQLHVSQPLCKPSVTTPTDMDGGLSKQVFYSLMTSSFGYGYGARLLLVEQLQGQFDLGKST